MHFQQPDVNPISSVCKHTRSIMERGVDWTAGWGMIRESWALQKQMYNLVSLWHKTPCHQGYFYKQDYKKGTVYSVYCFPFLINVLILI